MLHSLKQRLPLACMHAKQSIMHPCKLLHSTRLLAARVGHQHHLGRAAAAGAAVRLSARTACASAKDVEGVLAERRALQQLPTAAFGQVISAEANFVRVNISHLDASAVPQQQQQQQQQQKQATGPSSPSHATLQDSQLEERLTSNSQASTSSSSSSSDGIGHLQPPRTQLLCTVRALLKKINQRVLVGDRVRVYGIDWVEGRGVVEAVEPRNSELADPAIANVDHVLLLFGLTQPPFEPAQVSRFLVSVGASGLPVTLALNKCDLLPEPEVTARLEQVASWGYKAIAVSCETGQGLDEVAQRLTGAVSVVAGPSGAGKSSLINALRLGRHKPDAAAAVPNEGRGFAAAAAPWMELQQQQQQQQQQQEQQFEGGWTGSWDGTEEGNESEELGDEGFWVDESSVDEDAGCCSGSSRDGDSDSNSRSSRGSSSRSPSAAESPHFLAVGEMSKIGRGKHTTRTVTLIELPFGGLMADTPGFNQPTLDRVASSELAGLFPEFTAAVEHQGGCRFTDCMHLAEPGCAITAAGFERYEHYVKFLAEIKAREEFDVRVMQLAKQRREGNLKMVTGRGGVARYEARLDSKKHRTTSRRRIKQSLWDHKE